jgi:hypothetical protein
VNPINTRKALQDIENLKVSEIYDRISLATYSCGKDMVREVLEDWLHFLGGRPNQVIFTVSPATGAPPIYEELRKEGKIDRIIGIEPNGRLVGQIEAEAVRVVVEAAPTEWVLLIKLDTLPYRSGHAGWLADAMEVIHRYKLFGMTGSALADPSQRPLEKDYCVTQKYSNNFSLFRRSDWLSVINQAVGQESGAFLSNRSQFSGENLRFLNEYLIENHLEETGRKMLVRIESLDWSVFHVNVWGETLRKVRISYIKRKGVKRFLNKGKPLRRVPLHPWQKYYGFPSPPLLRHLRIVLGSWRRNLLGARS